MPRESVGATEEPTKMLFNKEESSQAIIFLADPEIDEKKEKKPHTIRKLLSRKKTNDFTESSVSDVVSARSEELKEEVKERAGLPGLKKNEVGDGWDWDKSLEIGKEGSSEEKSNDGKKEEDKKEGDNQDMLDLADNRIDEKQSKNKIRKKRNNRKDLRKKLNINKICENS